MTQTKRYTPQWYPSPIDLPERKHRNVRIRHRLEPAGTEVPVVGMRQAALRGCVPAFTAPLQTPLRITELVEERRGGGLWMTDSPEELNQIHEMLHTVQPRGHVLIGGLGLGCAATLVARYPGVTRVDVVERNASVIALCGRPDEYTIHHADLYEFLGDRNRTLPYLTYLLDTWMATSEHTWWEEIVPLRRVLAQRAVGAKVHCWAEDIMVAQVQRALVNLTTARRTWWYSYLPVPFSADEAVAFTTTVGTPQWEKRYGAAVTKYSRHAHGIAQPIRKLCTEWCGR